MFALYNQDEKQFVFKKNPGCGYGIKTAQALQEWKVEKVVYSFLGDGPFKTMKKDGMDIYYIGKEPLGVSEIIQGMQENIYTKVDISNAATYLDPGTTSGSCECGCRHE
jgi:predicted Fe-Mo cluster-binding NifX family protein